jgi:hypothetical protein
MPEKKGAGMGRLEVLFRAAGIIGCALGWAGAQGVNQLTAAEKKAGWILLFDGSDKFAEWKVNENGGANSNSWIVEDGAMKSPDKGDMLFSKKAFSNFEWQADWKLSKGGNSGLFIRVAAPPGWYCSGYEYAILDDANGGDRGERSNPKNTEDKLPGGEQAYIKRTGAVYDIYPTTKEGRIGGQYYDSTVSLAYGQWNHGVVWADGNFIEHWLNGKKVVDAEIGSAEWEARYKNSKFYPGCGPDFSKHPSGFLGVQDHGGGLIVWIRNLKIRPFTPGGKLVSPLITPAGGNFTGTLRVALEAAVTGASIHYTLDGSDPTESSPMFKDSLVLNKSATLKARTFRARFQPSDASAAVFTSQGSAARGDHRAPDIDLKEEKGLLRVYNPGSEALTVDIVAWNGERKKSFLARPGDQEINLEGLHGVYFVFVPGRVTGGPSGVRKIAVL